MKCPKMKWTKEDTEDTFGADAIRAYYAEFAGMVFFLGISVGTAVGAFKTVSGYSNSFLKVTINVSHCIAHPFFQLCTNV